jgi:hypothetical protein
MELALVGRQYTPDAIGFLARVMYDEKAETKDRLAAALLLLDRRHGRPSGAQPRR